jgi:hypothetical protein
MSISLPGFAILDVLVKPQPPLTDTKRVYQDTQTKDQVRIRVLTVVLDGGSCDTYVLNRFILCE